MKVGVVVALVDEARVLLPHGNLPYRTTIPLSTSLALRICGMGPESAAAAARALLAEKATSLVSYGLAGALAPGLVPGALVLPEQVAFLGSHRLVDLSWRQRIAQRLAPHLNPDASLLLTLKEPVVTATAKARMHHATGAAAVDMESGAVLSVAAEAGVPSLVLRAVVDAAETTLPQAALAGLGGGGQPRAAAVVLALLQRPWELAALIRLSGNLRAALQSLRRTWLQLGPEGLAP